jgi:hypothetical protein
MLAIYAYGTNTGIRAVAAGGGHGHSEDEVRYVRRRYLTRESAQAVAIGSPRRPGRGRVGETATAEDHRGLTPLFWQHVLPYGEVKLDMAARLSIRTTAPPGASGVDTEIP